MPEMSPDFKEAHDLGTLQVRWLHTVWSHIIEDFNAVMATNGFTRKLQVSVDDDVFSLRQIESAYQGDGLLTLAAVSVMVLPERGQLSCIVDLDPTMAVRTNEDPQDGTLLTETFHDLDDDSFDLLKRKIFAEIIGSAGPLEGAVYLEHYKSIYAGAVPVDRPLH